MSNKVVSVSNISKKLCRNLKFSLIYGVQDLLGQIVAKPLGSSLRKREFWALQNISFEISAGETVALIGRNGAGKTTLLRLLAGLIKPNIGQISIRGRVVPLIALGAGFSPSLSARENGEIFLSLLGASKDEINAILPQIFNFAELNDKEHDPVSSFSSGMVARLAFACAVFSKPDILLIDEVLAVGDLSFHLRCYEKLSELKRNGTALILVSHNLTSVLTLADRVIYLEQGIIKESGDPREVCSHYEADLREEFSQKISGVISAQNTNDALCTIHAFSAESNRSNQLQSGLSGKFIISFSNQLTNRELIVTVLIKQASQKSGYLLFLSSEDDPNGPVYFPETATVELTLPYCGLLPGSYIAKTTVFDKKTRDIYSIQNWQDFAVVEGRNINQSLFFQPHSWSIIEGDFEQNKKNNQLAL